MHLDIVWSGEVTPVDLADGAITVGGGPKDDIHLDGLPFKLMTLVVDGPRLSIKAIRPLRVGNQLFPAHVPRLVMPGEELKLPNDVVVRRPMDEASRERRRNKSTDFLAKELLANELPELESRAATLTCVTGADEGHVFPLAFLDVTLGRGDDVDVRLHDRSVSRKHARVLHRGLSFFVEDLATTNGIFVNGQRVRSAKQLNTGDVLELGHTMLRFEDGERAPEERTVIEKMPEPPSVVVAEDAQLTSPESPATPTAEPSGLQASITEPLPVKKPRFSFAELTVAALALLLMVSGIVTAALFAR